MFCWRSVWFLDFRKAFVISQNALWTPPRGLPNIAGGIAKALIKSFEVLKRSSKINYCKFMHRRIQNSAKHLRWSFLRKQLRPKNVCFRSMARWIFVSKWPDGTLTFFCGLRIWSLILNLIKIPFVSV